MANVKMEELARVQTVGPGGIGVYPPVPTEKVDKVSSAGLGKEELQRSANVLPHPGAVDDGAVMQEIDGAWSGGQGGGGSADIDLGVTDASVGDYLKVKSVDEDGKPTAWESEPVDTETIVEATDAWLEENVAQETGYVLDSTLTMSNAAAPANKVGELKTAIAQNSTPIHYESVNNIGRWIEKKTINSSGVVATDSNVMYDVEYLNVSDHIINGKICFRDNTENNGYFVTTAFYNNNKVFISRPSYQSASRILALTVPNNAVYFRIVVVYKINNVAVEGLISNHHLDQLYLMSAESGFGLDFELDQLKTQMSGTNLTTDTQQIPPNIAFNVSNPGQGLCKIGDNYIISMSGTDSYDSSGTNANINVYNSSFGSAVGYMTHNLGHGSGICYNETYNAFLMANGNADISPRLDILLNASENVESAINGSHPSYSFGGDNVMSIYLIKNGVELLSNADGAGWCIFGNDRLVLISLRDRATHKRTFYSAMLGVGTEDFSLDENGYGTFVSGKENTELNGTLKIIATYTNIGDALTSAQGMFYDKGKLIVSSSKTAALFYKIGFFETGYKIIETYKSSIFNADGSEVSWEPEGIVRVENGHFYCATTKGILDFYM